MPHLLKKIVKTEHIELRPASNGMSYGAMIDQQIEEALETYGEHFVTEFSLNFEEPEWRAMQREHPLPSHKTKAKV